MEESTTVRPGSGPGDWEVALAAHEGLVRWVVRQQWRGDLAFAEAMHAGRIGLWQALRHYDPTRGTRFSSYAVPAIQHAVWAAVAAAQPPPAPARAEQPATPDPTADPSEAVYQAQVRAAVGALVAQLPPRPRAVVIAHYGLGPTRPQSFAAIGRILGVSRQRVHQLHRAALITLAHPAWSRPLRRLVARHQRADYQQALASQRQHARAARRHRGGRR
jgi:RNA polymerase sigma factor (sigma-70 family)